MKSKDIKSKVVAIIGLLLMGAIASIPSELNTPYERFILVMSWIVVLIFILIVLTKKSQH
ncbi:MAG: hypothetical protein RR324_01235 [Cellulosilyticaceae bacterium]